MGSTTTSIRANGAEQDYPISSLGDCPFISRNFQNTSTGFEKIESWAIIELWMLKIEIVKTGIISMLEKISIGLGGRLEGGHDEAKVILNNKNGTGWIQAYELTGGISCIYYDIAFLETIEYIFGEEDARHLYFVYILQGQYEHRMSTEPIFKTLKSNQNIIVEVDPSKKNIIRLPKNVALKYVVINVENQWGNPHLAPHINTLSKNLANTFTSGDKKNYYSYFGGISLETLRLVEELYETKGVGAIKRMRINGTISKILASQILEHEENHDKPRVKKISSREIENCKRATEYISSHLNLMHTVDSISKIAGMNSKRLQECFKAMHQQTIIEFVNNRKLERSREWLIQNELNVSEIALRLGYNDSSYLSQLFKRKYGVSPLSFRKTHNITSIDC